MQKARGSTGGPDTTRDSRLETISEWPKLSPCSLLQKSISGGFINTLQPLCGAIQRSCLW